MAATENEVIRNHTAFIWSVADLLRGDFKRSEYGRVILPLVVQVTAVDNTAERQKYIARRWGARAD